MSRVGKYPVELPTGVSMVLADRVLQAKGKLAGGGSAVAAAAPAHSNGHGGGCVGCH